MSDDKFARSTAITFISGILNLVIGVGTSIILARVLGPQGKGIYTLAMLLPSLIVTFGNLGIGPATVYHVARGDFRRQTILGNNVLLALMVGCTGMFVALIVISFFRQSLFPGVASSYLFLTLTLVPAEIFSPMSIMYCLDLYISKSLTVFRSFSQYLFSCWLFLLYWYSRLG